VKIRDAAKSALPAEAPKPGAFRTAGQPTAAAAESNSAAAPVEAEVQAPEAGDQA